jgi:hypothetical protein
MKILVLILASDNSDIYIKLQQLWRRIICLDSNIESYFIKADPNIHEEIVCIEDTIYVKCEETYKNITYKSKKAFDFFSERISEFDYIFRTNVSSFIDFKKYKNWLNRLPKNKVYNGNILWYGPIIYASGCGFTCTPDVIQKIIEAEYDETYIDDIYFGKICMNHNIQVTSAPINIITINNMLDEIASFNSFDCAFHFRLKSDDRNNDIQVFKILLGNYYSIFV